MLNNSYISKYIKSIIKVFPFYASNPHAVEKLNVDTITRGLCLAPHADDESIGMGGLLLLNAAKFDVICLTDCSLGVPGDSRVKTIDIRYNEFKDAMSSIGVNRWQFNKTISDGELASRGREFYKLIDKIGISQFSHIFIPHPLDRHPDHFAVSSFLYGYFSKNKKITKNIIIVFYEVWSPMVAVNAYYDISNIINNKYELINKYKSQIKQIDYSDKIEGLNKYRGLIPHNDYSEAYFQLTVKEYLKLSIIKLQYYLLSVNKVSSKLDYLMITPSFPPQRGGVEKHVFYIHKTLKSLGYAGRLIILSNPPTGKNKSADKTWIPTGRLFGWVPGTSRIILMIRLSVVLISTRSRVIHFHDSTIYPVYPILKLFRVLSKTFITFHGWEGVYPPRDSMVQKRQKIAIATAGNIAIGDFISKWYGTTANIVSYGGGARKSSPQAKMIVNKHEVNMVYFGRLEEDTCIMDIIAGLDKFAKSSGNVVSLDIYGWGTLNQKIKDLANTSSFSLALKSPVDDVYDVIDSYDIVIASGYLTIIEALSSNKVVLSYYNNALREDYLRMHPAAESMLICGSEEDVSNKVRHYLNEREIKVQKFKQGWEWARHQTWESVADKYLQLWGIGEK